jgi:hypothetical protein
VLKWLLTNRKLVAEYMELKFFEGALSSTWWLVAMGCDYYYSATNITFDALKESSIVSKQYDNLTILMKELQTHSGACRNESLDINGREIIISDNIVSLGQFSVTVDGLKALCRGIEVEAMDLESSLNENDRETAFRAAATIYLVSLNGIGKILIGRQSTRHESEAIPCVPPLSIGSMSVVSFVELVSAHRSRLLAGYDDSFVPNICQQHKALIRTLEHEPVLLSLPERVSRKEFSLVWAPTGSRSAELQCFAAGIATLMSITSRVEGGFSLMNYRRNSYCSALTDFC